MSNLPEASADPTTLHQVALALRSAIGTVIVGKDAIVERLLVALPDDVKELAVDILAHRLILQPEARPRGRSGVAVIRQIIDTVPVPVE